MKPSSAVREESGLLLAEEAVLLLRAAPFTTLLCHFIGTLPFVLGLLYFIADMSLDAYAPESIVPASLWVALLFVWMKCWHAAFLLGLVRTLGGEDAGRWTPARIARLAFTQAALQPWGLLLRPAALVIAVPYAWVKSYYENLLIAGDGTPRPLRTIHAEARQQALLWSRQNWLLLSVLSLFVLFVWLNVVLAFFAIPWLLKTFLGLETDFTRNAESMLNTTTFSASVGATYLCTNPLWKAASALRWFRGRSIQSGADLRASLHRLRRAAAITGLAALLSLGVCAPAAAAFNDARPISAAPATAAGELNAAVEKTLERREFAWRLPRQETEAKQGWLTAFFDGMGRQLSKWWHSISAWIGKIFERWFLNRMRDLPHSDDASIGNYAGLIRTVVISLTVLIIGALGYLLWRQLRLRPALARATPEPLTATPDLNSETLTADQLPEDGWLQLAREMQAAGQFRLALRALYLAALAHLGTRKLITIARHKSNRDYERELSRRARQQPEIAETFRSSRAAFEESWYGAREVTGDLLGAFRSEVERIRAC